MNWIRIYSDISAIFGFFTWNYCFTSFKLYYDVNSNYFSQTLYKFRYTFYTGRSRLLSVILSYESFNSPTRPIYQNSHTKSYKYLSISHLKHSDFFPDLSTHSTIINSYPWSFSYDFLSFFLNCYIMHYKIDSLMLIVLSSCNGADLLFVCSLLLPLWLRWRISFSDLVMGFRIRRILIILREIQHNFSRSVNIIYKKNWGPWMLTYVDDIQSHRI